MLFWILAALLTLGACLAVLLPAVHAGRSAPADGAADLAVYRDQLAELERDVARGGIGTEEAEQARAEIGRRILRLSGETSTGKGGAPGRLGRIVATLAVLSVPLASWGIYAATGSPHLPGQPLASRLDKNPADSSIEELVARAEAHLRNNPEDGRGWEVLAPIYQRMGRPGEAVVAYRNAIRLLGASASLETGLGEALAAAAGGTITTDAQAAFERALALEPGNPRARFLLAAGLAQEGLHDEAVQALANLQRDLPADSPWREPVAQALANLGARAAPGPTREDMDAAGLISDKERAEMIDEMVAGLDRRLRDEPGDVEGWQRLVRSYMVLDRQADAEDALERGIAALGDGSDGASRLRAFAAENGVSLKE